jgi:hypothetical protein
MILIDRQRRVIWVYSGSGTSIKGVYEHFKQYDNMKDNIEQGRVEPRDLDGHHIRTMTEHRYTMHLRPLFFAGHSKIPAKRIVSLEGQCTDVFSPTVTS